MTEVMIRRYGSGLSAIVPASAPTVLDPAADADVLVLEVSGGHLSWNLLAGQTIPAAVIDDSELAQEWVWAIYGEALALALHDDYSATINAEPGLPPLAVSARRLAYAHWAARWWPASTLDGIAPLDPALLDQEIVTLTEECETLVDGADAIVPTVPNLVETSPRASDYALAAGDDHAAGLVLARGLGGWDWRRCPPGVVDASERAVSWQLIREVGETTVTVSAVAAPGLAADLPAHLMPWAGIDFGGTEVDIALRFAAGAWTGVAPVTTSSSPVRVDIRVPGFGAAVDNDRDAVELRDRIRRFAADRLRRAAHPATDDTAPDHPLLAEIAAAEQDSDF